MALSAPISILITGTQRINNGDIEHFKEVGRFPSFNGKKQVREKVIRL